MHVLSLFLTVQWWIHERKCLEEVGKVRNERGLTRLRGRRGEGSGEISEIAGD